MGKPATDYFCIHGHHVDGAAHHHFCELDMMDGDIPVCPYCGSTYIRSVIEWHDEEYWPLDENGNVPNDHPEVPHTPKQFEEVEKYDKYDRLYIIEVPVYDVANLFSEEDWNEFIQNNTPDHQTMQQIAKKNPSGQEWINESWD